MTQCCRQLINCLNVPIELTPTVKTIIVSAINCWKKKPNRVRGSVT